MKEDFLGYKKRSMSSLPNSARRTVLAAATAAIGIAAFAGPLVAPWYPLTIALLAVFGAYALQRTISKLAWGLLSLAVLYGVLIGYLSPALSACGMSAGVLALVQQRALSIAILGLATTFIASIEALVGDALASAHLEAAAPAIVASAVTVYVFPKLTRLGFVAIGGCLSFAWISQHLLPTPVGAMALAAAPAMAFVMRAAYKNEEHGARSAAVRAALLLVASLCTWLTSAPKTHDQIWVVLPTAPDKFESGYFTNYVAVLKFAGISAEATSELSKIPPDATVLLPWTTAPLTQENRNIESTLATLARERRWTVIAAGEHTNMDKSAERISAMVGASQLRDDLTVPPGNVDNSGPLRAPGLGAWPTAAILNRGASVSATSLLDKILLSGDGWWCEPDLGEWLWVGDYVWQPGDRIGRIPLAISHQTGGARWIVVGDNSLFINTQIVADPRPVFELLKMATLWPAFLNDLLLSLSGALIGAWHMVAVRLPLALLAAMTMGSCRAGEVNDATSRWRDFYVGESGFDARNFNKALVEVPSLLNGPRILRIVDQVSGKLVAPEEDAIIFAHVNEEAQIGGITFSNCWRLGSLQTDEGPTLMDAQACRVHGPAEIHIGSKEAAAVISVQQNGRRIVVVLDTAFLGEQAPISNASWIASLSSAE